MARSKRTPPPQTQRRHRRIPVIWPGKLSQGEDGVDCAILNISAGGAKLRMVDEQSRRGLVALRSPRFGTLHGRVVWRDEAYVGLAFLNEPMHVAETLGPALP